MLIVGSHVAILTTVKKSVPNTKQITLGKDIWGSVSRTDRYLNPISHGGRGNFTYLLEGQINFALKLSVGCLISQF